MCHSIKIDKDKKMAHITASETVDILELKEIFTEIIGHENWQAGFNLLCDYREIENFDISTKDIDDITQWQISIDTQIGDGRCAVVATKDDVFGMTAHNPPAELVEAFSKQRTIGRSTAGEIR